MINQSSIFEESTNYFLYSAHTVIH